MQIGLGIASGSRKLSELSGEFGCPEENCTITKVGRECFLSKFLRHTLHQTAQRKFHRCRLSIPLDAGRSPRIEWHPVPFVTLLSRLLPYEKPPQHSQRLCHIQGQDLPKRHGFDSWVVNNDLRQTKTSTSSSSRKTVFRCEASQINFLPCSLCVSSFLASRATKPSFIPSNKRAREALRPSPAPQSGQPLQYSSLLSLRLKQLC